MIRLGLDRLAYEGPFFPRTARLGVLTNTAARSSDGRSLLDVLRSLSCPPSLILTPEHGLDVTAPAGAPVAHTRRGETPVWSLYGADSGPAEEAIAGVDVLLADLPDVGCRYYTYPWTVREVLKMAARHSKPLLLLDRPNPLGGVQVEGSFPEPGTDSPVCASRVPIRHGLTLGELARWQVHDLSLQVELRVVAATGWRREVLWRDTGLPWVPPSPALQTPEALFVYPGTCLLEGTNVSEGRGTPAPFQQIGAPFVDSGALLSRLEQDPALRGARLSAVSFTPESGKWAGEPCQGVHLEVTPPTVFHPVRAGLAIVAALQAFDGFAFLESKFFDTLAGTPRWREALVRGASTTEIASSWISDERRFRGERESVLLYP